VPPSPMPRNLNQSDSRFHDALARAIEMQVEFPMGTLVTLVSTHMTPDTKHATGTLSVLPAGREGDVLQALREYEGEIKNSLGESLRLRRMPAIHWRFDHTEEEAAKIEADLHALKERGEL
jgi:ribosome-binding factor A